MNIEKRENQLFTEWEKKREELSQDGIVDEKHYLESSLKILFVLKEVNAKGGFDLRQFLREGGRPATWNNIARWTYGINNLDRDIPWKEIDQIDKQRKGLLKTICAVNLKKSPGGQSTNESELKRIAEEDKAFLNRQFQIYFDNQDTKPDFIISCGSSTTDTFNSTIKINDATSWKTTEHGIWYSEFEKGRYIIKYAHPEARVSDNLLYYGLIDAIKELKQKK